MVCKWVYNSPINRTFGGGLFTTIEYIEIEYVVIHELNVRVTNWLGRIKMDWIDLVCLEVGGQSISQSSMKANPIQHDPYNPPQEAEKTNIKPPYH